MHEDALAILKAYETTTLGWIREKWLEGLSILEKEPAYASVAKCMRYVHGDQSTIRARSLSSIHDNKLRKVVFEMASALTDVRPIWKYTTVNPKYETQAEIINKLTRAWWKNTYADRRLQSTIIFAACGGSGYAALTWNPALPGGGDLELIPFDPRDVVPIGPVYSDSIQDWEGVILRQRMSLEAVARLYPTKKQQILNSTSASFGGQTSKDLQMSRALSGPAGLSISGFDIIKHGLSTATVREGGVDIYRIFVKDDSVHTGEVPKRMGKGSGAYTVEPGQKLYPRGRMIICLADVLLEDSPNPYWHGLFPVIRLTLDPLPWSLLGASPVGDLLPMQDSLNEVLRGIEDGMRQWVRRGVVADQNAVGKKNVQTIDSRKEGLKVLFNGLATGGSEPFKFMDGPTFPNWLIQLPEFYTKEIEENSGVRGMQQLSQLKQMPSGDTIDKYLEALSPLLNLRARTMEVALAELAEMVKSGFFQFYTLPRRLQILGADGATLEDFDFNPGTMVPGGESPEGFHRQFQFSVAPHSLLSVSNSTRRMLIIQLFRANAVDIWTLWKALDLPDVGEMPAEMIPERMVIARKMGLQPGPTPEQVQAQHELSLAQAQAAMVQAQIQGEQLKQQVGLTGAGAAGAAPAGIPPAPSTSGVGPQGGRPPSGQSEPRLVMKDGGQRAVIAES